jgi:lipopolysaccharide heptosyltransferase II
MNHVTTKSKIYSKDQRILLLLFGGIGDVLLFTPALEALDREFPEVPIDAVVRNDVGARILKNNPNINEIIIYNKKTDNPLIEKLKLIWTVRKKKYSTTITICVDFDYKTGLLSFLSGAAKRIGPDIRYHSIFYNVKVPMPNNQHFIYRNYELVKMAGVKQPLNEAARFYMDQKEREFARLFVESNNIKPTDRIIGIHPGCSPWRLARRWSEDNYVKLIDILMKEPDTKIMLMGGQDEKHIINEISAKVGTDVVTVNNQLSLGQFGALIECCHLFICNDGGPVQLANAIDTATVTVVGPTNPKAFAPLGKEHVVVRNDFHCSPCIDYYDYKSVGCKEQVCIKSVTVSQVMEVISEKLKEISTGTPLKSFKLIAKFFV